MTDCNESILTTGTTDSHSYRTRYLTKELIEKCGGSEDLGQLEYLQIKLPQGEKIKRIENLELVPRLEKLIIQHQKIQRIEGIDKLINLTFLSLKGNSIEFFDSISTTGHVVNPRELKELPTLPQLQHLDLSKNCISILPSSLSRSFPSLKQLLLSDNVICDITKISPLRGCKNLEILNLSRNSIASSQEHYRSFVVHAVPSVSMLDDIEVDESERISANTRWHSDELIVRDNQIKELKTELRSVQKETETLKQSIDSKQSVIEVNETLMKKKTADSHRVDVKLSDLQKLSDKRGDQISELLTDLILVKSTLGELLLELDSCDMDFVVTDSVKEVMCKASRISSSADSLPSGNVTEKVLSLEHTIARRHQHLFSSPAEQKQAADTEIQVATLEAKLQQAKATEDSLLEKIRLMSPTDNSLIEPQSQITELKQENQKDDNNETDSLIQSLKEELAAANDIIKTHEDTSLLENEIAHLNEQLILQEEAANNELSTAMQAYDDKIIDLETDLTSKTNAIDKLITDLESSKAKTASLESAMSELQTELIVISGRNHVLEQNETSMAQQLEDANISSADNTHQVRRLDQLSNDNTLLVEENDALRRRVDDFTISDDFNSEKIADLHGGISELKNENEELRVHYNNAIERLEQSEQHSTRLESSEHQLIESQQECQSVVKLLENRENENQRMKSQLQELQTEHENLKVNSNQKLMDKIANLEDEIARKEDNASAKITSLQENVLSLTKDKSEHIVAIQTIDELESENNSLQSTVDDLQNRLASRQTPDRCSNCINLIRELGDHQTNESLHQIVIDIRNELSRFKNDNINLRERLSDETVRVTILSEQNDNLKQDKASLENKLKNNTVLVAELRKQIRSLEDQLSDGLTGETSVAEVVILKRQIQHLEAENKKLSDQNKMMLEELEATPNSGSSSSDAQVKSARKKIAELQSDNTALQLQLNDLYDSGIVQCDSPDSNALMAKLSKAKTSIQLLQSENSSLHGQLRDLLGSTKKKSDHLNMEHQLQQVKKKVATLDEQKEILRGITTIEKERASLQEQVQILLEEALAGQNNQIATLEHRLEGSECTLEAQIQFILKTNSEQLQKALATVTQQKQKIEQLEQDENNNTNDNSDLTLQLSTLREKYSEVLSTNADLENEMETLTLLQQKYNSSQVRIEDLESQLTEANELISQLKSKLQKHISDTTEVNADVSNLTSLRQKYSAAVGTISELEIQIAESSHLQQKYTSAQSRISLLEEEIKSNDQLVTQLTILRQKHSSGLLQIAEMEAELQEAGLFQQKHVAAQVRISHLEEQLQASESLRQKYNVALTRITEFEIQLEESSTLQQKCDSAQAKLSLLEEQRQSDGEAAATLSANREKYSNALSQIAELEIQIQESDSLKHKYQSAKSKITSLEDRVGSADEASSQLSLLRQKHSTAISEINDLKMQLEESFLLQQKYSSAQKKISILEERCNSNEEVSTQFSALRQDHNSALSNITDLEMRLDTAAGFQQKCSSVQSMLQDQTVTLDDTISQLAAVRQKHSKSMSRVVELESQLEDQLSKIENENTANSRISLLAEQKEILENENSDLLSQVTTLRHKNAAENSTISELELQVEQLQARCTSSQGRLSVLVQQNETLENDVSESCSQQNIFRQKLTVATNEVSALQLELLNLENSHRQKTAVLEDDRRELANEHSKCAAKISNLEDELRTLQQHELLSNNESLEDKSDELIQQLSHLRQKHAAVMTKVLLLEEKNTSLISQNESSHNIEIDVLKDQLHSEIANRIQISNELHQQQQSNSLGSAAEVEIEILKKKLHEEVDSRVKLTDEVSQLNHIHIEQSGSNSSQAVEIEILKERLRDEIATRVRISSELQEAQRRLTDSTDSTAAMEVEALKQQLQSEVNLRIKLTSEVSQLNQQLQESSPSQTVELDLLKEQLHNEISIRLKLSNDLQQLQQQHHQTNSISSFSDSEVELLRQQLHESHQLNRKLEECSNSPTQAIEVEVLKEQLEQEISRRLRLASQVSELQHQINLLECKLSSSSPREDPTRQLEWGDDQGAEITVLERELQSLRNQYGDLLDSHDLLKLKSDSLSTSDYCQSLENEILKLKTQVCEVADENEFLKSKIQHLPPSSTPFSISVCSDSIPGSTPRFPGSEIEILNLQKRLSTAEGELSSKREKDLQLCDLSTKLAAANIEIGRLSDLTDGMNPTGDHDFKKIQNKYSRLQSDYQVLSNKNVSLQEAMYDLNQSADQNEDAEIELEILKNKITSLESQNLNLTKSVADLSNQLSNSDIKFQNIQVKLDDQTSLTTQTELLREKTRLLETDNQRLAYEVQQKLRELDEKETECEASQSVIERLQVAIQRSEQSSERSEKNRFEIDSELVVLKERAETAESKVQTSQNRILSLELALQESQSKTKSFNEIIKTIGTDGTQTVQLNKLISQMSAASSNESVLQTQLDTITKQLLTMQGSPSKIAVLESEIVRLQEFELKLSGQNALAADEILRLGSVVEGLKTDNSNMTISIKQLTSELNISTSRNSVLQREVELSQHMVCTDSSPSTNQLTDILSNNKLLETEVIRLQEELEVTTANLQNDISKLESQLETTRTNNNLLEAEVNRLQDIENNNSNVSDGQHQLLAEAKVLLELEVKKLRDANTQLVSGSEQLSENAKNTSQLALQNSELQHDNVSLSTEVNNLQNQISNLKEKIEISNSDYEVLQNELKLVQKTGSEHLTLVKQENHSLTLKISSLEVELESKKNAEGDQTPSPTFLQFESMKTIIEKLNTECDSLKQDNNSLLIKLNSLNELKEENKFLRSQIQILQDEVARLKNLLGQRVDQSDVELKATLPQLHLKDDLDYQNRRESAADVSDYKMFTLQHVDDSRRGSGSRMSSAQSSQDGTNKRIELLHQEVSRLSEHIRSTKQVPSSHAVTTESDISGGKTSIRQWAQHQQGRTPLQEVLPLELNSDKSSTHTKRQSSQRHSSPPPRAASSVASQQAGSPGYHPQLFELHRQDSALPRPTLVNRSSEKDDHILVPRAYLESVYESTDLSRKMWKRKERELAIRGH